MNGILFKPPLIKKIVAREKDVTRRLITKQIDIWKRNIKPINSKPEKWRRVYDKPDENGCWRMACSVPTQSVLVKPRYHIGQVLFIREAWRLGEYAYQARAKIYFKFDSYGHWVDWDSWLEQNTTYGGSTGHIEVGRPHQWRSPLHLPASYARHFIQITDVRPERLQEITPKDVIREGLGKDLIIPHEAYMDKTGVHLASMNVIDFQWDLINAYHELWNSINGPGSWESNPWVWRIEFQLTEAQHG